MAGRRHALGGTNPIETLDDEQPVELIARGDYLRVARLISELEDPGAS